MRKISTTFALAALGVFGACSDAPPTAVSDEGEVGDVMAQPEIVTPETYIRAETDRAYAATQAAARGVNRFFLLRAPTPLDQQTIVRMNRDTLYGAAVVDTEGGASVTLPEVPDGRYLSVHVIDRDHRTVDVFYAPGEHEVRGPDRHLFLIQRVEVRGDLAEANRLQDAITIDAASSTMFAGTYWDPESYGTLRDRYKASFLERDGTPSAQEIAASGWGLLPPAHARYLFSEGGLSAETCYAARFGNIPKGAFWSVTAYGADGFLKSDDAYLSSREMDGDVVHFGSREECGDVPNRVGTPENWNYVLRLYRSTGDYTLPELRPL